MSVDPLPAWLADPALDEVFARLRERLERNGLRPEGRLRLSMGSREERHALSSLLGRSITRDSVTMDLDSLDLRLRERSGHGGLVAVVTARTGGALRDRPGERAGRQARREESLALAAELAAELMDGTWAESWAESWVADLRRTGLLSRAADPEADVRRAVAVLRVLVDGTAPGSRVELAAHVVGDAHALDEDRLLQRVVLRALAAVRAVPPPETLAERRVLWESFGVGPDAVSSTCLTLGLYGDLDHPRHVTRWDLRQSTGPRPPGRPVLVCENPRVLEAVAETHAAAIPVVCTSGEPNTVVTSVLELLVGTGATLRSHGDFDWPGIAIANRVAARFGAQPWLMAAADYERSVRPDAPELAGPPVQPTWDPELGAAMRDRGRVLHEETMLPVLLAALDGW